MTEENDRPATVGSDHKRRRAPSPAAAAILTRYRVALRAELAAVLDELAAKPKPAPPQRLALVQLAVKLAREVAGDESPAHAAVAPAGPRGRPPRLTARERASIE